MLWLGDIRIEAHEVLWVSRRGDRLLIGLRWPLAEVPLFIGLPERLVGTWYVEEDPVSGLPVRLLSWAYRRSDRRGRNGDRRGRNGDLLIRLRLLDGYGDDPPGPPSPV